MSKIEGLRVLVKHFLSVAADKIVEAVEKMIADYEGEISRQCKMLPMLLQPEIRLTRITGTSIVYKVFKVYLISLRMAETELFVYCRYTAIYD